MHATPVRWPGTILPEELLPRRALLLLHFDKPDRPLRRRWRVHEFADGLEDADDDVVVQGELAFQLGASEPEHEIFREAIDVA